MANRRKGLVVDSESSMRFLCRFESFDSKLRLFRDATCDSADSRRPTDQIPLEF